MASASPRIVVVTGAARGIGRALAKRFLAAGDVVAGIDVNAELLRGTARALESGDRFRTHVADVADRTRVDAAFANIQVDHGRVDVLINNAAIVKPCRLADVTPDDWNRVLGINLGGTFNCLQAALPMLPDNGRIINLSSHSGDFGSRDRAAYAASKGGINGLTRVAAVELAERGITVNAVAPGPVDTPHARANHSDARRRAWRDRLVIKRYATEEEIVAAVAFLASPEAGYITGQTLRVDGGMSAAGLIAAG